MNKKRKLVSSGVALGMAVVLALTGTFAWQSISQQAKNETLVTLNPGGRLHDDFEGEAALASDPVNKDVYVENFTDAKDGTPIYARVRLDEYIEIGAGAGKTQEELGDTQKRAESVVKDAKFDDVSTWTTYVPGEESVFDTYRELTHDGGKTVYLPTFNMNKDSLVADINGTYDGTDPDDDVHYDDYKTYTVDQEVTDDEVWDKDDNDIDEVALGTAVEGENIETKEDQTHKAKETIDGTVITMADWLQKPEGERQGNFWVWDTDGWAYWANPIDPSTATGLLLDAIKVNKGAVNEDMYYGINVVAQFVTAGDLGWKDNSGFYKVPDEKPTQNAETLLNTIKVTVSPIVSIREQVKDSTPGTSTITIDGVEFYVMAKDEENNQVLLLTKDVVYKARFGVYQAWSKSEMRTYLNDEWLPAYETLNKYAIETNVGAREAYNSAQITYSKDKVFLPSEADVFGTSQGGSSALTASYTAGSKLPIPGGTAWGASYFKDNSNAAQWLRDAGGSGVNDVGIITMGTGTRSTLMCTSTSNTCGARPLLWLSLVD